MKNCEVALFKGRIVGFYFLILVVSVHTWGSERRDILLVTIDTIRVDHMSAYGYPYSTTPYLEKFSKNATRFLQALTPVPLTLPAHVTLLTGLLPQKHGVRDNIQEHLSSTFVTLPELLKKKGYLTAAFVSSAVLKASTGIARGFDVFDDEMTQKLLTGPEANERVAEETLQRVLTFLSRQSQTPQPLFLWVHFFDPHAPYFQHQEFLPQLDPYDSEIAYVDKAIEQLINAWSQSHAGLIIITGDHGEALGDHGEKTHGVFLYNEVVHIPLFMKMNNVKHVRIQPSIVSLADIFSTVLEFAGIKIPESTWGKSLIPLLTSYEQKTLHRSFFFESFLPARSFGWAPPFAIMKGSYKYIHLPKPELYNVKLDPEEQKNRFYELPGIAQKLKKELFNAYPPLYTESHEKRSPENLEKLRSLGYVGGSRPNLRKDPKDFVWIVEELDRIQEFIREKKYTKALPLLRKITLLNPENYPALIQYGIVYEKLGQINNAIHMFERAKGLNPEYTPAYFNLGSLYFRIKEYEKAKKEFLILVKKTPESVESWLYLCSIELELNDITRAEFYLEQARLLDPKNKNIPFHAGLIAIKKGEYGRAIRFFKETLTRDPEYLEALINLAQVYYVTGNIPESIVTYEQVLRIDPSRAEIYLTLSALYIQKDDFQKALVILKNFVRKFPNHPERPRALEFIRNLEHLVSSQQ